MYQVVPVADSLDRALAFFDGPLHPIMATRDPKSVALNILSHKPKLVAFHEVKDSVFRKPMFYKVEHERPPSTS